MAVGKPLDGAAHRYATAHSARETRCLHVALGDLPNRMLSPGDIGSLAVWTVDQLAEVNDRGVEKHLHSHLSRATRILLSGDTPSYLIAS